MRCTPGDKEAGTSTSEGLNHSLSAEHEGKAVPAAGVSSSSTKTGTGVVGDTLNMEDESMTQKRMWRCLTLVSGKREIESRRR